MKDLLKKTTHGLGGRHEAAGWAGGLGGSLVKHADQKVDLFLASVQRDRLAETEGEMGLKS